MKYGQITFGQAEAVFNKLGGPDGVEKFLRGELVLAPTPKPAFPTWKTLTLGHPCSVKAYRTALLAQSYEIGSYASELLDKVQVAETETEARLVQVTIKDLGFKESATYNEIVARAKELGLDLCPAEVGPKLRLEYAGQPKGEYLTVAMEPIVDSSGGRRVFCVDRNGSGERWLSTDCVSGDDRWSAGHRFVFLSRK
jgi:hypothetical protein